MRTGIIPILCAALAACSSMQSQEGAGNVRLRAEPATVAPGDTVRLTLENGAAEPIGYNLCTSGLERRTGGDWTPVQLDRVCTMELRTLEPGRSATYAFATPADLAQGEYRATTGVERMTSGTRTGVASNAFRVTR